MTDPLAQVVLHCGWPRTGTTTLQSLLTHHRRELAVSGFAYPEEWQMEGRDRTMGVVNQNGLARLLEPSTAEDATAELEAFLRRHRGETVLLSSEELIVRRASGGTPGSLAGLIASLERRTQLTCVVTVRRIDDLFSSFYLHHMLGEASLASPETYFRQTRSYTQSLIAAMGELNAKAERITYVRYRAFGTHQEDLLLAFGIPDGIRERMTAKLRRAPRLNARLTEKTAAVIIHREEISARAGVPIPIEAIRRMYWSGELTFEGDRSCELLGPSLRRSLHEGALETARKAGFQAYVDFFEREVMPTEEASPPSPDALLDSDLDHLVELLASQKIESA